MGYVSTDDTGKLLVMILLQLADGIVLIKLAYPAFVDSVLKKLYPGSYIVLIEAHCVVPSPFDTKTLKSGT